jgi:homocysteine S-methyltransferase
MAHSDTNASGFAVLLASGRAILIDGGLATQCEAMGHNIDGNLWSAVLLKENPRAIVDASRAYLDAGAEIIATASYQASRKGLVATGLSAGEADDLIVSSVSLAQQTRDEFIRDKPDTNRMPLIAASIGPYGAVLHDGSEYTGAYDVTEEELAEFHRERLELLDAAGADILACETIPSFPEAQVLCELLRGVQTPAWISFSCKDEEHLCDGAPLVEAAAMFRDHPTVQVVGVNCIQPHLVVPLIEVLGQAAPDKAIVVYPNSGEVYRADDNSWSGTVSDLQCERSAQEWIDAGARLIGGCCRIGPEQIAAMAGCAAFKM